MRWFIGWLLAGGFVGGVVATLVAPWVLETLLASTGAKDAMCQCSELVANTSRLLVKTQLSGVTIGAVLFPLAAWLVRRARAKSNAPAPTPVP